MLFTGSVDRSDGSTRADAVASSLRELPRIVAELECGGKLMGAWSERIATAFADRYPRRDPTRRCIGREGEHPVVHANGEAADIGPLWPQLAELGSTTILREEELIVGLEDAEVCFAAEVGRGTIEIIVGPCPDLHEIRRRYESGMGPCPAGHGRPRSAGVGLRHPAAHAAVG